MRAVLIEQFGDPEVLKTGQVQSPTHRPDQMLVKVAACGVCGHDLINRTGKFSGTPLPCVMGHEIAGTVVEIGALVTKFKAGDRIAVIQRVPCGKCRSCRAGRENLCRSGDGFYGEEISGGYGEYVIANERNAVILPEEIPFEVGAILSCAIGTGLHALNRANLRPGDTVVITGASGGVGIHAVQVARVMGARVIGITSADTKAGLIRSAGADHVIVAPDLQFHRQVRELTDGEGADVVMEITGAPSFESSVRSLMAGGQLVMVGNVRPGAVPLNPAISILKEINVIGSGPACLADLIRVVDLVTRGLVKPHIAAVFPIEQAAQAHALMANLAAPGRVVLTHNMTDVAKGIVDYDNDFTQRPPA
jgi:acryloyl-coenzyme A reductase